MGPDSYCLQRFDMWTDDSPALEPDDYCLERRDENVVVVRVRSRSADGTVWPDAVFTFRPGDPQYSAWERQLRAQELSGG